MNQVPCSATSRPNHSPATAAATAVKARAGSRGSRTTLRLHHQNAPQEIVTSRNPTGPLVSTARPANTPAINRGFLWPAEAREDVSEYRNSW